MAKQDKLLRELSSLEKEELTLFRSYNRHANSSFKLDILNQLMLVIVKIDVLKQVKE